MGGEQFPEAAFEVGGHADGGIGRKGIGARGTGRGMEQDGE
jgi:hypothetical protein